MILYKIFLVALVAVGHLKDRVLVQAGPVGVEQHWDLVSQVSHILLPASIPGKVRTSKLYLLASFLFPLTCSQS